MIARLSGKLVEISSDGVVLEVGGVGYLVQCSGKTLDAIGPVGGDVLLLTELQVREDAWTLFGFGSTVERDAFRALTSVQGVGGRLALAILTVLSPDELSRAISQGDKEMIGRASGVGPKLAVRVITELKGKVPTGIGIDAGTLGLQQALGEGIARSNVADAVSALGNLGYSSAQASAAVAKVVQRQGDDTDTATLIRLGLRELSAG